MTHLIAALAQLLHLVLMLAAAPVALGLAGRAAARLAGRAGAPLWQPWRDLRKLAAKQAVFAETASGLFETAPAVAFAASVVAAALVPSFALGMLAAPFADLVVVVGLLSIPRVVLALAAAESGVAVGGIGASRAMALSAFTAPAALLAIFPLALLSGTTSLDVMTGVLREGMLGVRLPLVLAVAAILVTAAALLRLAAAPATTLLAEAAMAEAALAEEYSGRHLALLHWAGALRRLVWLTLLVDLAAPVGIADAADGPLAWGIGVVAWAAKLGVLTLALALWQAGRAARPQRVAEVLGLAVLLGALAAAFLFAGQGLV